MPVDLPHPIELSGTSKAHSMGKVSALNSHLPQNHQRVNGFGAPARAFRTCFARAMYLQPPSTSVLAHFCSRHGGSSAWPIGRACSWISSVTAGPRSASSISRGRGVCGNNWLIGFRNGDKKGTLTRNVPIGQRHSLKSLESGTVLFSCKDGRWEEMKEEDVLTEL